MRLPTPAAPLQRVLAPEEALQGLVDSTFNSADLDFYLNGTHVVLNNPNPAWTLLDFIRSQHGLQGTKLGCGEGGCGACTVVLQTLDHNALSAGPHRIRHLAVNACLYPLVGGMLCEVSTCRTTILTLLPAVGKHVITIEALGNVNAPHPLQERLTKFHGSQYGPQAQIPFYFLLANHSLQMRFLYSWHRNVRVRHDPKCLRSTDWQLPIVRK